MGLPIERLRQPSRVTVLGFPIGSAQPSWGFLKLMGYHLGRGQIFVEFFRWCLRVLPVEA